LASFGLNEFGLEQNFQEMVSCQVVPTSVVYKFRVDVATYIFASFGLIKISLNLLVVVVNVKP
jgi:hypothetical protein